MKKALTVSNVLAKKTQTIPFTGALYDVFGNPQRKGRWLIWGVSGGGKSSLVMQLSKAFAKSEKILYNLLEEDSGDENFQDRLRLFHMHDVKDNFFVVEDDYDTFCARLEKRNSAQVAVIDSALYFFRNQPKEAYWEFRDRFAHKLLIFTAHANGTNPRTEFETTLLYDATQKVFVNAYLATNKGRKYGPNSKQFVIWQKGYDDLHGARQD